MQTRYDSSCTLINPSQPFQFLFFDEKLSTCVHQPKVDNHLEFVELGKAWTFLSICKRCTVWLLYQRGLSSQCGYILRNSKMVVKIHHLTNLPAATAGSNGAIVPTTPNLGKRGMPVPSVLNLYILTGISYKVPI